MTKYFVLASATTSLTLFALWLALGLESGTYFNEHGIRSILCPDHPNTRPMLNYITGTMIILVPILSIVTTLLSAIASFLLYRSRPRCAAIVAILTVPLVIWQVLVVSVMYFFG